MKQVFSSKSDVARLWANQSQHHARTTGRASFYFYGEVIYSYGSHFPIAKLVNGQSCLFTTQGYSNTTAKHINETRYAASRANLNVVYCWDINSVDRSIEHFEKGIKNMIEQIKNPRNRKHEARVKEVKNIAYNYRRYVDFMNTELNEGIELSFVTATTLAFLDQESDEIIAQLRGKK